ncbi:MAG: TetR/AcrR family transcriptional regulator [Hylemonella sp.]|nr:TetR/AcrR family transcriptional regulator [Hylemonella sp.]
MISRLLTETCAKVQAKRERRKDARPGELLAAALELFVEKGYAATRSEEVARRAGVSKGTLFLYFASKEELFKAVVRENIAGRFAEWNAEFETYPGSTPEMLRYAMMSWWERVGNTPAAGITKLMMSEASNFPELAAFYQQEVIEPGHELIRRILQRGVDRGEFRPMDMAPAIYVVLAPMIFLMSWKHSFGACESPATILEPEKYLELQVQTLLYGLCAPTGSGTPSNKESRQK